MKEASKRLEVVPATYKTVSEQVLVKEAGKTVTVIPAVYKTETESYLVKEASKRLEVVPATYKTVTEQMLLKDASTALVTTLPVYETITERIKIRDEYTKYEKGKLDSGCLSSNPDDCRVLCYVTVAAEYKTITKQVLKVPAGTKEVTTPASTREVVILVMVRLLDVPTPCAALGNDGGTGTGAGRLANGGSYCQTVTKQMVASAAQTREIEVPAQYATRTKSVLVSPATTRVIQTPAQYGTRTRQVVGGVAETREIEIPAEHKTITKTLVKSAARTTETTIPAEYGSYTTTSQTTGNSYADWQEILCEQNLTTAMIIQIQRALKTKGYEPGPIDDIIGVKTKAAILQFQKDNNSATRNYRSIETLKALGVMN